MNKDKVIEEIEAYLREELIVAQGEGQDDLAVREINRLLTMYRFLPKRKYGRDDVIIPSALVELKLGGISAFYFIAPQGGGLVTRVEGKPVQVITPQSPLGECLLGKRAGDRVRVETRSGIREYQIISIS